VLNSPHSPLDLDYMNGYEALRESAAWIDLSARGKICMNGDDRARLLYAITTNHIQQLTPGTGCYVFFLNAQRRVLADANILCREESLATRYRARNTRKHLRPPRSLHHRRRRDPRRTHSMMAKSHAAGVNT
jgi:glycine cleavage system aminomethyltransferase T